MKSPTPKKWLSDEDVRKFRPASNDNPFLRAIARRRKKTACNVDTQ